MKVYDFGLRLMTRGSYRSGLFADNMVCATLQHLLAKILMIFNRCEERQHLIECLQGVLETNLPGLRVSHHRCLTHELSNQVICNHVGTNLVSYPMRLLASQVFHLHMRL